METSFTKNLIQLYKGFEFRTLWNVDGTLKNHQRLAVGAAPGTGQLRGVLELNKALTAFNSVLMQGQQCFSQFIHQTSTHKWSFNSTTHPLVSIGMLLTT